MSGLPLGQGFTIHAVFDLNRNGSFDSLTIGMTLYWVIYYAAIINSWWWWWLPPIIIIIVLFTGLFLIAVGLDEFANPRLRKKT